MLLFGYVISVEEVILIINTLYACELATIIVLKCDVIIMARAFEVLFRGDMSKVISMLRYHNVRELFVSKRKIKVSVFLYA